MPTEFLTNTLKYAQDMIARGEQDEIMPRALIPPNLTLQPPRTDGVP
jgi:hypothetical protein